MAVSVNAQEWKVSEFGPAPDLEAFDLIVGDVRNDDVQRVYVSTKGGDLYEWTYNDATGKWDHEAIVQDLKGLVMIDIGDVRNDGKNRLYLTEFVGGGRILELGWTGSAWEVNLVDKGYRSLTVLVGEGRNDGKSYLYVGSTDKGAWEYEYVSTGVWKKIQMNFKALEGVGAVGASRNDSVNRVVLNSSDVKEYTWDGSKYTVASPSTFIEFPDAITLAQGRNDGINRIYANCLNGRGKVEYTWNGSGWKETKLHKWEHRGDIYGAAVKADGLTRIYSTSSEYNNAKAGPMKEYAWNESSKQFDSTTVVDATSGATAMVVAGYGRNDDTLRLYATNYKAGKIMEITNKNPFVVKAPVGVKNVLIPQFKTTVYPNPSSDNISYSISNPNQQLLKLELLDFMGIKLRDLDQISEVQIAGAIDLSDQASGIYYLRVSADGQHVVQQIILTK